MFILESEANAQAHRNLFVAVPFVYLAPSRTEPLVLTIHTVIIENLGPARHVSSLAREETWLQRKVNQEGSFCVRDHL